MATALSVNLNAVAMLRNRRDLPWPSVTHMGEIALEAGAAGLTVHPRPDERHIRRTDVFDLAALVAKHPGKEFNVEGYPSDAFLLLVEEVKPHQVTLVPDDPSQPTSDHGWDFTSEVGFLKPIVARLKEGGMRVSLFCDPDAQAASDAAATGTDRVEIYTGPYGHAPDTATQDKERDLAVAAYEAATQAGLGVNAGHDLTLENLPSLIARAPGIAEVSIGHAFTADALIHGFAETVKLYRAALETA